MNETVSDFGTCKYLLWLAEFIGINVIIIYNSKDEAAYTENFIKK